MLTSRIAQGTQNLTLTFDQAVTYASIAANKLDVRNALFARYRNASISTPQTGATLVINLATLTGDGPSPTTLTYTGTEIVSVADGTPLATFSGFPTSVDP